MKFLHWSLEAPYMWRMGSIEYYIISSSVLSVWCQAFPLRGPGLLWLSCCVTLRGGAVIWHKESLHAHDSPFLHVTDSPVRFPQQLVLSEVTLQHTGQIIYRIVEFVKIIVWFSLMKICEGYRMEKHANEVGPVVTVCVSALKVRLTWDVFSICVLLSMWTLWINLHLIGSVCN